MLRAAVTGWALLLAALPLSAQDLIYSPDISAEFSSLLLHDEDAASDDLAGTVTPQNLGPLPPQIAVVALHRRPNGDQLFVVDSGTNLNGLFVTPRDVIRYDGNSHLLEFNGGANGLPDGICIDALSEAKGRLQLSFDGSLAVAGLHIDDEDLVAFHNGGYQIVFDGSAAGIDPALDLDGAHAMSNGQLLLSFDGSSQLNQVHFDDEDVLAYDPGTAQFSLAHDGSAFQPAWSAADLDALTEPFPGAGPGNSPGTGKGHDKNQGKGHEKGHGRGHRK